jgi:hypothetical protein
MIWGEAYGKRGIRKYMMHRWPCASDLPQDPYAEEWHTFSRFERLCWAWSRLNQYALDALERNDQARLFLFESIFQRQGRYEALSDLVRFTTSLPGLEPVRLGDIEDMLKNKVNPSSDKFPAWDGWTKTQQHQFERICGPSMEQLGYII